MYPVNDASGVSRPNQSDHLLLPVLALKKWKVTPEASSWRRAEPGVG